LISKLVTIIINNYWSLFRCFLIVYKNIYLQETTTKNQQCYPKINTMHDKNKRNNITMYAI